MGPANEDEGHALDVELVMAKPMPVVEVEAEAEPLPPLPVVGRPTGNELGNMRPEHIRIVALRLRGKRWSEIATALGFTSKHIWMIRRAHPEIDRAVAAESFDALEAARIGIAALVPKAVRALAREIAKPDPKCGPVRITAAKYVLDVLQPRIAEGRDQMGAQRHALERLTDGELDAALSDGELERH